MNRNDYDMFVDILQATSETTDKKRLSDGAIAIYWKLLERFDFQQVTAAITGHLGNPAVGTFMPKPADIIREIEGLPEDRAVIVWATVERGIRGEFASKANYVVFDDPIVHRVVDDMGGFSRLGRGMEKDIPFARKDFVDRYMAYSRRGGPGQYPKRLPASDRPSPHREDVLYLGEHRKALAVLENGSEGFQSGPRHVLEVIA